MLKTQRKSNSISDCDREPESCYSWYCPFAWNPFYPLSRTMLYYPCQLNPMYQNISNIARSSECSSDAQSIAPVASSQSVISDTPSRLGSSDHYGLNFGLHQQPSILDQYPYCGPIITAYGTISVQLQHYIRVDITVDKAIRLINFPGRCVSAINFLGNNSCIIHPTSKILQEGITVNMKTGNRLAKISKRGITFTSLNHSLVYLVDASGTKSTVEHFQDLNFDFSLEVFYSNALCGEEALNDCFLNIANSVHRYNKNGDQMWIIAGVCIQQNLFGDVRVTRDYGRRVMHTSPTLGTMSVSTPFIYMAAGCDPEKYFFVQRGEKRLSSHVRSFRVKNGTQKAGFDSRGRLVLG